MDVINELIQLTQKMLNILEEHNDRDNIIAQYETFVNKRGKLIKKLSGPYNEKEKHLGRQLVELDQQLQRKVEQFFNEIAKDYDQVKKKKTSNEKYVNPYKNVYEKDGAFIDKKK